MRAFLLWEGAVFHGAGMCSWHLCVHTGAYLHCMCRNSMFEICCSTAFEPGYQIIEAACSV